MGTFIYTLASSRNPAGIRYVGKTRQSLKRRLQGHICGAKKYKELGIYSVHNYNWINHELSEGYEIIIEELDCVDDNWELFEQYWICQLRIWGFHLTNIREGGEDNYCPHPSKEVIEKRAAKLRGIPRSQETRDAISKGLTGIKRSEETRQKVRDAIIQLQGVPVNQYDFNGQFIRRWDCMTQAAQALGLDKSNIYACCNRKKHFSGGYVWRYVGDDLLDIDRSLQIVKITNDVITVYPTTVKAVEDSNISNRTFLKYVDTGKEIKGSKYYRYCTFYKV